MAGKPGHKYADCAISLLRRFHPRAGSLHLRRAELEFGNLAEWIERRIGEDVRRRLDIGEGDEHDAIRNSVILLRIELDGAARTGQNRRVEV